MLGTTHNLVLFPSCLYLRVTSQKAVFLFLNIFRQELLIDSSVFCDLYSSISYLCVKSVAVLYLELCLETCLLLGWRLVTFFVDIIAKIDINGYNNDIKDTNNVD